MKRILRGVPRMRNAMLLGVAGLAARIPDDTPEVIDPGTTVISLPLPESASGLAVQCKGFHAAPQQR